MNYRRMGRFGLKVSEIAYGSWTTAGGKYPREQSIICHKRAYELGINLFDTADVYNNGQAEEIIGEVLQQLPRKNIVLATKCCGSMGDGPNDKGTSRKHVTEACHASLRRLKTDYIDLYQAHSWDAETPLDETCRAYDDLVRQGKILYWGISNWSGATLREAVALCKERGWDLPVSFQPRYHMFARDTEKEELPACVAHGLGAIVYSPLSQGLLTGKYQTGGTAAGSRGHENETYQKRFLTDYNQSAVKELVALASEQGTSLTRLALAWVLRRPEVSAAIVGATQPQQLEDSVGASGLKLSDEVLAKIQKILDRRAAAVFEEDARNLRK